MTNEQFNKYKELQEQVQELDDFLHCCGVCYEDSNGECKSQNLFIKFIYKFKYKFKQKTKTTTSFCYYKNGYHYKHDFIVPKPLQVRIAKTVYEYKKEIEKEMKEL